MLCQPPGPHVHVNSAFTPAALPLSQIEAHPNLNDLNGVRVSMDERRACLGDAGFNAWAMQNQGTTQRTLSINILAEKVHVDSVPSVRVFCVRGREM